MFTAYKAMPPRERARWLAYALALLAPGSFVVLPLLLLGRLWKRKAPGSNLE